MTFKYTFLSIYEENLKLCLLTIDFVLLALFLCSSANSCLALITSGSIPAVSEKPRAPSMNGDVLDLLGLLKMDRLRDLGLLL